MLLTSERLAVIPVIGLLGPVVAYPSTLSNKNCGLLKQLKSVNLGRFFDSEVSSMHIIVLNSKEYHPWDPGTMVHSFTCLMLFYDWGMFLLKANNSCFLKGLYDMWELLVRIDLAKVQFQWCGTMCVVFFMADTKNYTSKSSVVKREIPWFLYWNYEAVRLFSGVTNVADVLLPQVHLFMPSKLCDVFFPRRNQVQSFVSADCLLIFSVS